MGHWPTYPRTRVWGGTTPDQVGDGRVCEDAPDSAQNSSSPCLAAGLCWYFRGCYGATESSGAGGSLCPALPAIRRQLPYKRADSSAPLTGGVESGGTMDVISVQQLVRTWVGGGQAVFCMPQAVSTTRRAGSFLRGPRTGFLEQKRAVVLCSARFSREVVRRGVREQEGN